MASQKISKAGVSAARALYFPAISLTGLLGVASLDLGELFDDGSSTWNYAGTVTGPIFQGGAVLGTNRQAEAQRAQLLANYERTVQRAFADVDDALIATQKSAERVSAQLRQSRLAEEGLDMTRFRAQMRDQLLVERAREREVIPRIRVSEAEVDAALDAQRRDAEARAEVNLAQILVAVPESADAAQRARLEARAEQALARVRAGEPFEAVARDMSDDPRRAQGGEIGLRSPSRLPDLFVEATRALKPGDVTPAPLRSGAGFHVLKVLARAEATVPRLTQTRVRHILLKPSGRLTASDARDRLAEVRQQIERGQASFEDQARRLSEDGSAAQGGDLGWAVPGMMVPEFEAAMDALPPGALSSPVVSRFGVHLIQVLERRQVDIDPRQQREQVRAAVRERKFDEAYAEWARELRSRAYIELREPPL